ncbi:MAG TPA: heavy metal-binding domain-containing protein, partial [Fimbriimonas sp.]|nr:heavy metal-binding domain-containing protein [Fimbriimonas sp.]
MAAILVIRWIVATQRSPGAITVIEAQAMDMAAMKAPPGAQPVETARPALRKVGNAQELPATVMAFSDEEIVARVPGKVMSLAYPGDQVNAGQIVAKLDANEYFAQKARAQAQADSGEETAAASDRELEVLEASRRRTRADVNVAQLSVKRAEAEKQESVQELEKYNEEAESAAAKVKARQADLTYSEQSLARQQSLYRQGFTSLDQYQVAQRARDVASATVEASQSEARAKEKASEAAAARISTMDKAVQQAEAQAKSAQLAVVEASRQIDKARSEARAAWGQSKAARQEYESAAVVAGYTKLRALDDCMVSERYVSPGAIVAAGEKLLMLHNANKVRVQAQAPESLAASVGVGTPVTVRYGDRETPAKVTSVFPTADTSTRTFTIEVLLDNPGRRYLPGSFATLSVETQASQSELAIPSSAVQSDSSGNSFVWVVKETGGEKTDWTCPMHTEVSEPGPGKCPICKMELVPRSRGDKWVASRRVVHLGGANGRFTAVTDGLSTNDEVITADFDELIEGIPVKAVEESPLAPSSAETARSAKAEPARRGAVVWTCRMHPAVVRDHPGTCPKCG